MAARLWRLRLRRPTPWSAAKPRCASISPTSLAGGGEFRTTHISEHTRTNAIVLRQMLGVRIELAEGENGATVRVG